MVDPVFDLSSMIFYAGVSLSWHNPVNVGGDSTSEISFTC